MTNLDDKFRKGRSLRVLVTGAGGFVGTRLVKRLVEKKIPVIGVVRREIDLGCPSVTIQEINRETSWKRVLDDCNIVVHLAARVHVMQDTVLDPLAEFRVANVDATLHLARQAIKAGVRRFVFLSSVKVCGEESLPGKPFTENIGVKLDDPYALSKYEAEIKLLSLARGTEMEIVILRPPLVYGPGVKANFHSLMEWIAKEVPLPLGAVNNKRSLIFLDNLVDCIMHCFDHPAAVNQVFLVSDGEDLSTTELLQRMAIAMKKPSRLFPVPQSILQMGFTLLGKKDFARRLCGSLQVDIGKVEKKLDWRPPFSVSEGLQQTARWFLQGRTL